MKAAHKKRLDQARALLEQAKEMIDKVHSEADDAWNDRSEKWQRSEKGEAENEALDQLELSRDGIETAIEEIDQIVNAEGAI
jgi:hypothetical protein